MAHVTTGAVTCLQGTMDPYESDSNGADKALLDKLVICEGFVILHKCLAVERPMQCHC